MTDLEYSRLDLAVVAKIRSLSRASAAKLIEAGHVFVNGQLNTKPSHKVKPADKITVDYNFKVKPPKIDLKVIYQDDDVIVIDKPVGLLSHSKGALNPEATVATWLANQYSGPKGDRAGIVHRLDRATSGLMIVARNEAATKWLQKQFSGRRVKKTYIAIVSGHLSLDHAIIELPIERNPKSPQSFRVGAGGKPSITEYSVLATTDNYSLVELKPTTGRTHQLRVHLAHLGHPIVGDPIYKGLAADRLYLHAQSLELTLPSKKHLVFESPLPKEFKIFMNHE